jgi:hypothetical protein
MSDVVLLCTWRGVSTGVAAGDPLARHGRAALHGHGEDPHGVLQGTHGLG